MSDNENIFVLFRKFQTSERETHLYIYINRFHFAIQSVISCQTIPLENVLVLEVICNYTVH